MKKIILIISFAILIINCDRTENGSTYIYTIQNQSGVPIKIKSFNSSSNISPIITNINIGEDLTKKYETSALYYDYFDFSHFFSLSSNPSIESGIDSIVIIYNNEKYKTFISKGCLGGERNPLNICVYNKIEETFIFTVEDYQNAEDCNGNCD